MYAIIAFCLYVTIYIRFVLACDVTLALKVVRADREV
jgi:hypothetical protein